MLILRKIIQIVATICHILRLKCTKFDFGWGSVTDPAIGSLQRSPDAWLDLRGSASKMREGRGREGAGRREEKDKMFSASCRGAHPMGERSAMLRRI